MISKDGKKNITKKQLINYIHDKIDSSVKSRTMTEQVFNCTFDTITELLVQNEGIILKKFGTFETVVRAPRAGRNPMTGAPLHIPETNAIVFKAGTYLKSIIKDAIVYKKPLKDSKADNKTRRATAKK